MVQFHVLDDQRHVYWIVPAAVFKRHATIWAPGALPDGEIFTVLCGDQYRYPYTTPPACQSPHPAITQRCAACQDIVDEYKLNSVEVNR